MEKKRYAYDGPVLEFDRVIAQRWRGSTLAATPAKARSNLAYQFKRETGRIASCKVTLPDRPKEVI